MLRNRSFGLVLATSMTASMAVLAQNAASPKPRQLKANGTDLTFVDQGKGAPIVFVHGAVGDLRFWEPQRTAFAKNHRYVAYTLRYHGTGAWPDAGKQYGTDVHSADLAAFISALKAGPVHLVGLSLRWSAGRARCDAGPIARPLADARGACALRTSGRSAGGQTGAGCVGQGGRSHDGTAEGWRQRHIHGEHTPVFFSRITEAVGRCVTSSQTAVIPKASHTISAQNAAAFNSAVPAFVEEHR